MLCIHVTFDSITPTTEDSGGSLCVNPSASGDVNHQAAACSARSNNVPYGYGSPGVFPKTREWKSTGAHTVSGDPTGTWKSHDDVAFKVSTTESCSTVRPERGPVHLRFDDHGKPLLNDIPASSIVETANPVPSVHVYLDMFATPTSRATDASMFTATRVDHSVGQHPKCKEFFGQYDDYGCGKDNMRMRAIDKPRRNRAGELIRCGGKGQHSSASRRGYQTGRGYHDGHLRPGLERWMHTGQWTPFEHKAPRRSVNRARYNAKGGSGIHPRTGYTPGGAGYHPMRFPECDTPGQHSVRPDGARQNYGYHASPMCVAVAAPFEPSQYRQQLNSQMAAVPDDNSRPRDTDTKMRLATFDGEISSWTGWSFSCLAYFRRSKREAYLLGEVPVPLLQTEAQIRRALIGADLSLGPGDRKYVRTKSGRGGAASGSNGTEQPDNVGTEPQHFDHETVVMPIHTAETAAKLNDDVASVLALEKRQYEAWQYTTTSIFDELVMSTEGQAAKLVHSVTSRFGHDAWIALNDEYGKLMKGDRTLFTRRLTNGEVTQGQIGMQEGDSVKSFIRDLNSLHSALYWCVPQEERASVPELQYDNMKEVLQNSLSSEYLTVLTAHDGAQNGNATYKDLCLKVITHENLLVTRGVLRGTSGTGVVAAASSSDACTNDDDNGQRGHGTKRTASNSLDPRGRHKGGKGGGKGYNGGKGGNNGGAGGKGGHGDRREGRECFNCGSNEHIYRYCPDLDPTKSSASGYYAARNKHFQQAESNGEIKDIKKALAMLVAQGAPAPVTAPVMAATTAAPASGGFMDGWMNVAACETNGPLVFGTQTAPVLTDSARVVRFNADGNRGWVTVDFRASEPRCRAHYHAFRETSADHQGLASGHVCYQGTVAGQRADCNGDADLARSLSESWEQTAHNRCVSKDCSGDAELAHSLSIADKNCYADADIAASLQERPREDCSADADLATSLQERPRDDCSCDEQLARVLAGVNIATPKSVNTGKLVQGKRTQTARKNYARNERRREQKAKIELGSAWSAAVHAQDTPVTSADMAHIQEELEEYRVYLDKLWLQRQPNKYEQTASRIMALESSETFEVSHPVVPVADRKCDQHDYSAPFTANHILHTDLLRGVPCMQHCDGEVPISADSGLEVTALALTVNNADSGHCHDNVERAVSFETLAVANKSQRSLYDTDVFIIDTGAGELVSPHEGDFVPGSFVEPYGQRVVAAGSEKHTVVKLGRLRVRCVTTGHTIDSGDHLAWYVPTMTFRLGGMGRLRSIGYGLSIGLGDADFLCHVLSGVKVPVLTYNQVSVLRVEQTGIDSTLAAYLTGRFAEESALGKALSTSCPSSPAMVVVGELMTASVSNSSSTRCLSETDSTTHQESAGDRHARKHSCAQMEPQTGVQAPANHETTDNVTAADVDADTTCSSTTCVPQEEDDECGGDDHVYPTEDEHNRYVESTIADIGDGLADAMTTRDSHVDAEYDPLAAIAEAEAEYAAEVAAGNEDRGPTAAEFMAEHPKYSELMQIASTDERKSLVSFAQTIDATRGDLSMRCEILTSATDIMLSRTLLGAKKRIREQSVDLTGDSEPADTVAAESGVDLGVNESDAIAQ